jgi:hypothetical protein
MIYYPYALLLHSWLRWAILATGAFLLVRTATGLSQCRPWRPWDQRSAIAFLSVLDTQVLLGISLYVFLSPITPKSMADFRAFMPVSALRFFAVEHVTGMLVAATAAHVAWTLGKRAAVDRVRHRRVLVGVALAMLMIAASIPWPWLSYGRPLVRAL